MDGRAQRGRGGGSWKRGGGGGGSSAGDSGAYGERRGRGGRGGRHRGRGRRDQARGRGRAPHGAVGEFRRDEEEQEGKENSEQDVVDVYSRRKLESNWDRYEELEKEDVNEDIPIQRGTDFHVLLSSAGDSFTQFRFSEEKDWEMDSLTANQVPAIFVDLEALAQSIQELPLHKRLNLEADLVQGTTPAELPSVGVLHKGDSKAVGGFNSPAQAHTVRELGFGETPPVKSVPKTIMANKSATAVTVPVEDADEELDLLLGLQKPVTNLSLEDAKTSHIAEEVSIEEAPVVEEREEELAEVDQMKTEDMNPQAAEELKPEADSVKKEMTEDDLEDWLDSMIS